jgi:Tfp pilus assembly protein PilF
MSKGDAHLWKVLTEKLETLCRQRNLRDALRVGTSALAIARRGFDAADLRIGELLETLGELACDLGDDALGRSHYIEALAAHEAADNAAGASRLCQVIGANLWKNGESQQALAFYEKAVEWAAREREGAGADLATVFNTMAILARQLERTGEAEQHYLKALRACEEVYGHDHPNVATILGNLGVLYFEQEQLVKAADAHARALQIREQSDGVEPEAIAQSLGNLAITYHAAGDTAEAGSIYQRAAEVILRLSGPLNADSFTILENYGNLLRSTGQAKAAAQIAKQAAARGAAQFGNRR